LTSLRQMEIQLIPEPCEVDQLLYCSLAATELDEGSLERLVADASAANQAMKITGMLMVHQGMFLQWIEGPRDTVALLWRKILKDPRHHCIVRLVKMQDQSKRSFPNWSMNLVPRGYVMQVLHDAREAARDDINSPWAPPMEALIMLLDSEEPQEQVRSMHRNALATGAQTLS
jgi:Sensors of blue-light using FAD